MDYLVSCVYKGELTWAEAVQMWRDENKWTLAQCIEAGFTARVQKADEQWRKHVEDSYINRRRA